MPIDVNAARQLHRARLQPGADAPEQARQPGVQFKSRSDGWGALRKIGLTLSVVGWPIAMALGHTQKRVMVQSANMQIDSGVSKSEFRKLRVPARPDGQPDASAPSPAQKARDEQVRSIALRLIKAGGGTEGLNQVLAECPTEDLVLLARDCATDRSGEFRQLVFDGLRAQVSQGNQAWRSQELIDKLTHYRQNQAQLDARIQLRRAASAEPALALQEAKQPIDDGIKNPLVKNFFDKTLHAKPSAMLDLRPMVGRLMATQHMEPAQRQAHLRQVFKEHKDAVTLLVTFPELGRLYGLPDGLAQALQTSLRLDPAKVMGEKRYEHIRSDMLGMVHDMLKAEGVQGLPTREELHLPEAGGKPKTGLLDFANAGLWGMALKSLDAAMAKPAFAAAMDDHIEQGVQRFQFAPLMTSLTDMNLEFEGEFKSFVQDILGNYFDAQSPLDKKTMLASMFQMPADPRAQMVGILRGSGPYMQKLLQQFGDKIKDPEVRGLLEQLKTGLNPIDETERKALLADILRQPGMEGAQLLDAQPVSSASVAEALSCKIQKAGEDQPREYIVKLLRPGIEQRAGREREYFETVAKKYGGVAGTYAAVADQIEGELDLRREAAQVERGQVYTAAGRAGVKAMRLAEGFVPQKDALIIERAPGQTIKSFLDATERGDLTDAERTGMIDQGRALASQLSQLSGIWLKEALLGQGFYHGDMHAGNVLTDPQAGLTLIDFGNAGSLSPQEQSQFLLYQAAILKNKPQVVVQALAGLLPPRERAALQGMRAEVEAEVKALMVKDERGTLEQDLSFAVIDMINRKGLAMPALFVNLCRAQDMLLQAHKNVVKRVNVLIEKGPDPKPELCDDAEMDRENRRAVDGELLGMVSKLGALGTFKVVTYQSPAVLLREMERMPAVAQAMVSHQQALERHEKAKNENAAYLDSLEVAAAKTDVMNAAMACSATLYAKYGVKNEAEAEPPEHLRPALQRVLGQPTPPLADLEAVAALVDEIDPALMARLRVADATFKDMLAAAPPLPARPEPVYPEDVYIEAIRRGAAPPAQPLAAQAPVQHMEQAQPLMAFASAPQGAQDWPVGVQPA